ncbi:MAG: lactate utilization protein C [Chloroflexi bacterium]|nr:MAG: lactate utilization protein C [Chloroflexota bacterium]
MTHRPATAGDPAREAILDAIRRAFPDRRPVEVPREYERAGGGTRSGREIVDRFAERVAEYRATVVRTGPYGLSRTIAARLAERHLRRLVVPDGVPAEWLSDAAVEIIRDEPPLSLADLDATDAVLTGCAIAIAETGTIVLDAGPDQGRRALSLLPDDHLCVVRGDQVVDGVPDALARLDPRRPLTWISGPSATSDIELDRVEGVHGPRNLTVLIVGE